MKLTRREFLHLSTAAAVAGGVTLLPVGQAAALAAPSVQQLVEEAYLYAFPLVLMDATKIVSTNTETATERRAPVNQLIHVRSLMDASSRTVVSPNVDTIYTQAWLDVRAEPMLYVVPETDRFFNVQVLDGWTGISGNNLATVLLRFDEESQQMIPADQISTSELYSASLRNVPNLVSRDLDGDGTVEIPTQPDEAGLLNMSQSRRMDFIVWMDYTSPTPEKSFGLLDEETNCYIELPAEWEGNLLLTDSTEIDAAVELRTVDENELVLTLRLVSASASAAGWTRLGVVASRQMQAKLGEGAVIKDQTYRLSRSLYRLN